MTTTKITKYDLYFETTYKLIYDLPFPSYDIGDDCLAVLPGSRHATPLR